MLPGVLIAVAHMRCYLLQSAKMLDSEVTASQKIRCMAREFHACSTNCVLQGGGNILSLVQLKSARSSHRVMEIVCSTLRQALLGPRGRSSTRGVLNAQHSAYLSTCTSVCCRSRLIFGCLLNHHVFQAHPADHHQGCRAVGGTDWRTLQVL